MTQIPISEPARIVLEEPAEATELLAGAGADPEAVARIAGRWPTCLSAWATLGELALEAGRDVESYAYFRVGYHRGLDQVRKAGWKGSGVVPWGEASNQGFLRSLRGLGRAAAAIGEQSEAERCEQFLKDLAPDAP